MLLSADPDRAAGGINTDLMFPGSPSSPRREASAPRPPGWPADYPETGRTNPGSGLLPRWRRSSGFTKRGRHRTCREVLTAGWAHRWEIAGDSPTIRRPGIPRAGEILRQKRNPARGGVSRAGSLTALQSSSGSHFLGRILNLVIQNGSSGGIGKTGTDAYRALFTYRALPKIAPLATPSRFSGSVIVWTSVPDR